MCTLISGRNNNINKCSQRPGRGRQGGRILCFDLLPLKYAKLTHELRTFLMYRFLAPDYSLGGFVISRNRVSTFSRNFPPTRTLENPLKNIGSRLFSGFQLGKQKFCSEFQHSIRNLTSYAESRIVMTFHFVLRLRNIEFVCQYLGRSRISEFF